ncbi:MAG TPA: ABC transporter ATP-binding protein [Nocardioidaceae bacterium]|nr:ABC transporter ATP-binding protein [Nocardioidaceae bacterium]
MTAASSLRAPADVGGAAVRCVNVVQIYTTAGGHDVVALRGVNLDIRPGERVALLGPSGSGKSTLLSLFGGVLRPSAGKVLLDGRDISRLPESELGRLRSGTVASLLQGAVRNLLPYATGEENLRFARRAVGAAARRRLLPPRELLARLGAEDLAARPVRSMSGGERQRVAFAATLASGPRLLLADEPTSQLGHDDRDAMIALIHQASEEFGTTVVLVTHDPEVAQQMPRSITIRNGRIGSEGRHGLDYAVVDQDGAVHLPDELAGDFPAGRLVAFEATADGLLLRPVEERGESR